MNSDTIPCRLCGFSTPMLGTQLCNTCWELEHRIFANPVLARRILTAFEHDQLRKAAPPPVLSPGGRRAEAEHSGLVLFLLGALLLVALLFWFRS